MKLHVLSDLHEEFGPFELPVVDRDMLVLAGDVHLGQKALPLLKKACVQGPVIYVLGNHEFYDHDFDKVLRFWLECNMPNLHVLENRAMIIDNVRFIGATLWTSMNQRDPEVMKTVRNMMNDYYVISKGDRILLPEDTISCYEESARFLEQELQKSFPGPTVVVTHHLPSFKSVAKQFESDIVNGAFASSLDDIIHEYQPAVWIHGHTHVSCDYFIGKTRIVCNPRGYWNVEPNPDFQPKLVIDL